MVKYSIRGKLSVDDGSDIVTIINKYTLWRLVTGQIRDMDGNEFFSFEVWLNSESDKDILFNEMKPFVDLYGEMIDWHKCSHDEESPQPCVIAEEYRGE